MAKVLQPFALSFSMEDQNGDSGSFTLHAPATTPTADLEAVAPVIMGLVDPMVKGQTIRYGYQTLYKETAYAQPTSANGNSEDKGVFTFVTAAQFKVSVSLPTFDPAKVLDTTSVPFAESMQIIDITDVDVAAFVAGVIAGFTDGSVTIIPAGSRTEMGDIVALHSARYVQSSSPRRSRKAG